MRNIKQPLIHVDATQTMNGDNSYASFNLCNSGISLGKFLPFTLKMKHTDLTEANGMNVIQMLWELQKLD